jgi:CTP:phosphocholine cytidylyltransferase-like protein
MKESKNRGSMKEGDLVYFASYKHPKRKKMKWFISSDTDNNFPPFIVDGLMVLILYGVSRFRVKKDKSFPYDFITCKV